MSPETLARAAVREVPLLGKDEQVGPAVRRIVEAGVPALPIVDDEGKLCGIFGEREFINAMFPGYLGELKSAAFVPRRTDEVIDKRLHCRLEPALDYATTDHVAAGPDPSDAQLAETFLHHRVLIVPVLDDEQRVTGVVTRWDFFKALTERLTAREP